MKNQDCEMIVVPIATNLMDLDHAQPLAETNYSAVSHSGNDFGQLDGIQVAAGLGHATAAAGPARKNNNNMPSTPLRIDEAAPAVTSTITSSAAAAAPRNNPNDMDSSHGGRRVAALDDGGHDGRGEAAAAGQLLDSKPKQPFSTTVITSNTFSSKRFDDSNKMKNKISNMNLTSIIDYNFNYPMTSNTTTLIKPSDDNENENTDDVDSYSDPKMTSMNFSKMSTAGAKKPNRPSIVDYSSDNDKEFKRQLFVQDEDQITNAAGDLTSTCLKVCSTISQWARIF